MLFSDFNKIWWNPIQARCFKSLDITKQPFNLFIWNRGNGEFLRTVSLFSRIQRIIELQACEIKMVRNIGKVRVEKITNITRDTRTQQPLAHPSIVFLKNSIEIDNFSKSTKSLKFNFQLTNRRYIIIGKVNAINNSSCLMGTVKKMGEEDCATGRFRNLNLS